MNWKINYTARASNDLSSIYEYIAYELFSPDTARSQFNKIVKAVKTLDYMPMKYKVYDKEPWKSQGVRYFPVGKYLVFYLPEEESGTVSIIRIVYGGRDIERQLKELTE